MFGFKFFGIGLSLDLQAADPNWKPWALSDFDYFRVAECLQPQIQLRYSSDSPPRLSLLRFRFGSATFSGLRTRVVHYPNSHWVRLTRIASTIEAQFGGKDPRMLNEILHKLVSSVVGWELEKRGWQRLHACAFISKSNPTVHFGPAGWGKSFLSYQALVKGLKIYSDECVWISPNGSVEPWPIAIRLAPSACKILGLAPPQEAKLRIPVALDRIAAPQQLQSLKVPGRMIFLWNFVLGLGHQQILEFNLRVDTLHEILWVLLSRSFFAWHVFFRSQLVVEPGFRTNSHRQLSSS